MEQEQSPASSDPDQPCVHHWVIDQSNLGVCKKCGSVRQFCRSWEQAVSRFAWSTRANKPSGSADDVEK